MRGRSAVVGVLSFLFGHWRRHLRLVLQVVGAVVVSTAADVLLPILSGVLVDDVGQPASDPARRASVMVVLAAMTVLGLAAVAARRVASWASWR